jgi:hypothetical protein
MTLKLMVCGLLFRAGDFEVHKNIRLSRTICHAGYLAVLQRSQRRHILPL